MACGLWSSWVTGHGCGRCSGVFEGSVGAEHAPAKKFNANDAFAAWFVDHCRRGKIVQCVRIA
jgi:hypothetical protein